MHTPLHQREPAATFTASPQPVDPCANPWDCIAEGDAVYARVISELPIPIIYGEPSFNGKQIPNNLLEKAESHPIRIDFRYQLTKGAILRARKLDDDFAHIERDNGRYSPFSGGYGEVYLPLADLDPIRQYDPITLNPDIQAVDKQIIVTKGRHPELLAFEGEHLVLRIPVALGGLFGSTNTPSGDHRISWVRASRHMPGYPGVGFPLYFSQYKGYAVHDSYWWYWDRVERGFYGSGGCINVPNDSWRTVSHNDEEMLIATFLYRWISTNMNYDEATQQEIRVSYRDPGYDTGISAVRLISVVEMTELWEFPLQGAMRDWEAAIEARRALSDVEWVLPQ